VKLLARLWRLTPLGRRRANVAAFRVRPGFICPRHWEPIVNSWGTRSPINPYWVMSGIAVYLQLTKAPPEPTPNACCLLPEEALQGVYDLSRNRS
jgi:hypothetical protein